MDAMGLDFRNCPAFPTVFGRGLVREIPAIARRPYLVVTMADLWPRFGGELAGPHLVGPHCVETIDGDELDRLLPALPLCGSVVGLGGGQAIDVAKYVAWSRGVPLFQVPTATSVDAPFGQRAGLRYGGDVRYVGFAVPEAVYVDFDVIGSAPPQANRGGIGEILCFHTARADWRLARDRGRTEPRWPYDERLVAATEDVLAGVVPLADEIRVGSEAGIRGLMTAMRWAGAAFHACGWNPRPIEGVEHFVFYALEKHTGRKFIHGQPVCLGVIVGSLLHDDRAAEMIDVIHRAGVDVRPEAMGVSWADVEATLLGLRDFVHAAGLWYGIAHEAVITPAFVAHLRGRIESRWGPWPS